MEWAWATGLFEGEGCIYTRVTDRRSQRALVLNMTDEDMVNRFHAVVGCGTVRERQHTNLDWKRQWEWRVTRRADCVAILERMMPLLSARRAAKARELIGAPTFAAGAPLQTHCMRGHPLDGPDADVRVTRRANGSLHRQCRVCVRIRKAERAAATTTAPGTPG